ncbi:hypothetical protein BDN72DRAFT_204467 [Pluteus cervinus]|uniref:Uncharacterized protein n=1 Tax=Pluteus cervinus TaxID=181527 RepID=A0ACD3AI91_9AGAR|nr:hypothetical protein BDN72DRAFT_204467 [Pluteus cervinus]
MDAQTISAKRATLRAEEARLALQLSNVRSQLNELVPVSSLPTDILEEVFAICVSWLYGSQKPKYRLAWTQVCRVWRRVSLDSARLWHCIDLSDPRFAREFLARSKSSPISIISASPLKLYTADLHSHAKRLQSIDVFLFPDDLVDLFTNIGPDLSKLTELSLRIPPVASSLTLDISISNVQRLTLDAVAVKWDTCMGLTHLSLRGLIAAFSPSITELQSIFSNSPYLEYIRLENLDPTPRADDDTTVVHLAHLHELVILGKDRLISAILSCISFTPRARLRLTCTNFQDFSTFLPKGLPYSPDENLAIEGIRLTSQGITFLHPSSLSHPWSNELQDLVASISSTSQMGPIILSSAPKLCNLFSITVIELNTNVLHEPSSTSPATPSLSARFEDLLTSTVNLTTLRISQNPLDNLLTILSTPPSSSHPIICPHLSRISFGRSETIWWHFHKSLDSVLRMISTREEASPGKLKVVEFVKCHGVTTENVKGRIDSGGSVGERSEGISDHERSDVELVVVDCPVISRTGSLRSVTLKF